MFQVRLRQGLPSSSLGKSGGGGSWMGESGRHETIRTLHAFIDLNDDNCLDLVLQPDGTNAEVGFGPVQR